MYKTTKFKIILYMIFSNLFFFIAISSNYTLQTFKQNTWYTPIIALFIYLILVIAFPNNFTHTIKKIFKCKICKMFIKIFLLLESICILYFSIHFFYNYVSTEISIIIYLIVVITTIMILSNKSIVSIINTSSIFYMISLLLYSIPILSSSQRYSEYILPISFNFSELPSIILVSFIPVDNIILLIYYTSFEKKLSKKDLMLGGTLFFVLLSFIYLDSLMLISYKIYLDYDFSFFFHWQLYTDNKYISNYNICLLFIMLSSIIFKSTVNIKTFKVLSDKKNDVILSIIILILTSLVYYSDYSITSKTKLIAIILSIIMLIVYVLLYFTFRRKKYD